MTQRRSTSERGRKDTLMFENNVVLGLKPTSVGTVRSAPYRTGCRMLGMLCISDHDTVDFARGINQSDSTNLRFQPDGKGSIV